ncbi:MAG: UDP-2,3-diacylglucosamine diphosphatase [bacterium]
MAKMFFVSDAHIGSIDDVAYKRFMSFIDRMKKETATHLFILGDLFEFLHGRGAYITKKYNKLFTELESLSLTGTKIYYLYGNHDFDFTLPFNFIHSASSIDKLKVDAKNIMVSHGDGLDPKDTKYRFLKSIVRSGLFRASVKMIPDSVLYRLAGLFSVVSRSSNPGKMVNDNRFLCYRDYAVEKLSHSDLDVVVLGHTHVPDLSRVTSKDGKIKYYINTGYFGKNGTYGMIDNDTVCVGVFNNKMLLS